MCFGKDSVFKAMVIFCCGPFLLGSLDPPKDPVDSEQLRRRCGIPGLEGLGIPPFKVN